MGVFKALLLHYDLSFWILNFMSIANVYFINELCDVSCMFGFKVVVGDFCGVFLALFHFENQLEVQ